MHSPRRLLVRIGIEPVQLLIQLTLQIAREGGQPHRAVVAFGPQARGRYIAERFAGTGARFRQHQQRLVGRGARLKRGRHRACVGALRGAGFGAGA
jgi:hypothetical protein